jgi:hypothetical protein
MRRTALRPSRLGPGCAGRTPMRLYYRKAQDNRQMKSALAVISCQRRNQLEAHPDCFWHTMAQVVASHPAIPSIKSSNGVLSPRLNQKIKSRQRLRKGRLAGFELLVGRAQIFLGCSMFVPLGYGESSSFVCSWHRIEISKSSFHEFASCQFCVDEDKNLVCFRKEPRGHRNSRSATGAAGPGACGNRS